jgi:hypothetical protein
VIASGVGGPLEEGVDGPEDVDIDGEGVKVSDPKQGIWTPPEQGEDRGVDSGLPNELGVDEAVKAAGEGEGDWEKRPCPVWEPVRKEEGVWGRRKWYSLTQTGTETEGDQLGIDGGRRL